MSILSNQYARYIFSTTILSAFAFAATPVAFRAPRIYPERSGPATQFVAVGDFNGDGKPDVVAVNTGGPNQTISIWLNQRGGILVKKASYPIKFVTTVVVGDFDGDGKLDLAATNHGSDIKIMLGNGDGTFRTGATYPVTGLGAAVVGDFNRDGKLDLAAASGSSVAILTGNGDGTFQSPVSYPAGGTVASLTTADFNGDGKPDLAVALSSAPSISILFGNSDGTFGAPVAHTLASSAAFVISGDLNGDGHADLAAATGSVVSVLLGTGAGTFQPVATYPSVSGHSIAIGDFNGDGKLDLACTGETVGSSPLLYGVSVLSGNGDGTFLPQDTYAATAGLYGSLAAGDFNGDGKTDLVAAVVYTGVMVMLSSGESGFLHTRTIPSSNNPNYFATGDFDEDGKLDFATGNINTNYVEILLSGGHGTLHFPAREPTGFLVADFNGDGHLDLAVVSSPAGEVSILLGNGDGTFQPTVTYATGTGSMGMAAGDFNGDGKLDLAVTNFNSDNVSILLNRGDGTFETHTPISFPASSYPWGIAAGDFNGDGLVDLAVGGNGAAAELWILAGDGHGSFTVLSTIPTDVEALAPADFNRDGKMDLVALTNEGAVIFLGNGDGTFQPAAAIGGETPFQSTAIARGDFNGDGIIDLVLPTHTLSAVQILIGKGDGTFQLPAYYLVGPNAVPYNLATGDFNGDGRTDVAVLVGPEIGGDVALLLNLSPSTLQ